MKKITNKFALAAALIFSAALAHASTYCDTMCAEVAAKVYAEEMKKMPPNPGSYYCGSVAEQYRASCIASIDALRVAVPLRAQQYYTEAYNSCKSSCGN